MTGADRLGTFVRRRRTALDLSQRDAAARARISDQTWLNVEHGRGASERKLAQIERALDWPPGTIDAILGGSDPPPVEADRRVLLLQLAAEDLTRDEIEQVIAYVTKLRRRRTS
ncbi:MAG: helix-turn-helix domain-containing protein [Candidatus Rokuibacteriota bacterium]